MEEKTAMVTVLGGVLPDSPKEKEQAPPMRAIEPGALFYGQPLLKGTK
jgi:hypothetical protein